jgi:hypothetical protein
MTRRAFRPTDEMREQVRSLAARGVRHEDIAGIVDCDPKTLRKHFRYELDRGKAAANADITGALYEKAMGGDTIAAMFWLKAQANWRECKEPGKALPGADSERNSGAGIVLPDNNRGPELTEELLKAQEKYFIRKQRRQSRDPKG